MAPSRLEVDVPERLLKRRAQLLARVVEVRLDGAYRDAQELGDFAMAQVLIDA